MNFFRIALCAAAFIALPASHAATLTLTTTPVIAPVGNDFLVSLRISGLGAESLATLDLDLTYNPAVVAFADVEFGDPVEGDQLGLLGIEPIAFSGPGVGNAVNIFISSLNTEDELNDNQLNNFTIFTMRFTGLATGQSVFSANLFNVLNAAASEISAPAPSPVTASVAPIPEPATLGLTALAGLGFWVLRSRRKS